MQMETFMEVTFKAAFTTLWLKCTHHVCLTHQPTNPVDFFPPFSSLNCSWENPSPDAPDYTWRKALVSIGTDPSSVSAHSPVNPHVTPSSSTSLLLLTLCAFMQPPVELLHLNSALRQNTFWPDLRRRSCLDGVLPVPALIPYRSDRAKVKLQRRD